MFQTRVTFNVQDAFVIYQVPVNSQSKYTPPQPLPQLSIQLHHRTTTLPATYASPSSGGLATLSGTSGFTSVTSLSRSSTTLSPVLLPASLIRFSCSSASLLASSSAFLLPLVCYIRHVSISCCVCYKPLGRPWTCMSAKGKAPSFRTP